MSKQLLIEHFNLKVDEKLITESRKLGGKLILEGVIQRANAKNQNGRVYPKHILERELKKYIEGPIRERRAFGELDHPECFIDGYKIMTLEKGWVDFNLLDGEEHVATINPISKILEYQKINKVINQPYSGDIINIESKTFQANVTPNHRFLITNQYDLQNNKSYKFKLATELNSSDFIPKRSEYIKDKIENIIIENEYGKIELPSNLFASFMGWWLSEGWLQNHKNTRGNISRGICLSQSKEENFNELDNIYSSLSNILGKKWSIHGRKNNEREYYILEDTLFEYLSQFGLCNEKFIPREIKELDKENIQIFLDAYLKADGSKQKNQEVYYTTSYQMSLDLHELINLIGFMSSVSKKELAFEEYLIEGKWVKDFDWYTKKEKFDGKLIENKRKHYTGKTLYSIRRKYSDYYRIADCKITTTKYKGNIYCVSVPNETILVMSPKGSTFWSGNSQIVNLKNVSHNITDIWWNGDDVYGRIEILDTPSGQIAKAIIEAGCSLGISSRAMGSVQTLGEGTVEVQDDLSMVCFDLVSEPSTQGAFVKNVMMNENVSYKGDNKYSKINEILSEIVCSQTGICCLR